MVQKIALSLAALFGLLVIATAAQNMQPMSFSFAGASLSLPPALVIIGAWLAGLTGTLAVFQQKVKSIKSEKQLEKWQTQDAKLQLEVESDRIKQLEAKIQTLEVALTKALEKKKS